MTVRSLTSFAKSASNFLAARDNRQEAVARAWRAAPPAGVSSLVFLSLNVPGADKNPPGVEGLFLALHHALLTALPQALEIERAVDALGPYALYRVHAPGDAVKRACIGIENARPSHRLADLDVYVEGGHQIGRRALGLEARSCLLCPNPAVDCMRLGSHPFQDLLDRVHELLTPFRT